MMHRHISFVGSMNLKSRGFPLFRGENQVKYKKTYIKTEKTFLPKSSGFNGIIKLNEIKTL